MTSALPLWLQYLVAFAGILMACGGAWWMLWSMGMMKKSFASGEELKRILKDAIPRLAPPSGPTASKEDLVREMEDEDKPSRGMIDL